MPNEDAPSEVYIFVNQLHPMVRWNFNINGRFQSGGCSSATSPQGLQHYVEGKLNFCPFVPRDLGNVSPSPYCLSAISDYWIEYDADYWRERVNRLFPSRLSAVFAFGDLESCRLVCTKYGWPIDQVHKFKIGDWRIGDLSLTRIVKVNMEIVSLLRMAFSRSCLQDTESVWRHYWSGGDKATVRIPDGEFQCETIWEYLIDGYVDRITGA